MATGLYTVFGSILIIFGEIFLALSPEGLLKSKQHDQICWRQGLSEYVHKSECHNAHVSAFCLRTILKFA